jgi:hypothetical protein
MLLALPREAHETKDFNGLAGGLGKNRPIDFQDVSETPPKPSLWPEAEKENSHGDQERN